MGYNGAKAWGECGRSGQRMLLKDMVEDGRIPGLKVHPGWYEPQHPQEHLIDTSETIGLRNPSPSHDYLNHTVTFPLIDLNSYQVITALTATLTIGDVTMTVS